MYGAEDFTAAPPLGPELTSGKWRVRVIDGDARITEELVSGKEVWSMRNRRVMVDFNRKGQIIKDSGGLFGSWLGSLSNDLNMLPIDYTDWRKVPTYRKEMAWKVIQKKFCFDDPRKRKKYVLSILGCRCRDLKQRIWRTYRRNTLQESFDARPGLVPEDQWKGFVEMQFTDKAKEEETGREPNRGELFIASRSRSDGTFVCEDARICADKLKEVMTESSIQSEAHEAYEQVFGPENSGRVRCVGRGPTPSKYFSNLECTSSTAEVKHLKGRVKDLEDKLDMVLSSSSTTEVKHLKDRVKDLEEKLDIVTDALCKLVESKVQDRFQVIAL
ncbi:unnamed protein product [Microthlaspi erraticum]|uniref:Uncharacterized protein n=1 Tax=Microthlaspi erraticum TaxID=1685480 RepID=A0A6D2K4X9_9BRAS|nr:unnamed protein product [Microthlaspi erraticum]